MSAPKAVPWKKDAFPAINQRLKRSGLLRPSAGMHGKLFYYEACLNKEDANHGRE
jgi:hypothetical protein